MSTSLPVDREDQVDRLATLRPAPPGGVPDPGPVVAGVVPARQSDPVADPLAAVARRLREGLGRLGQAEPRVVADQPFAQPPGVRRRDRGGEDDPDVVAALAVAVEQQRVEAGGDGLGVDGERHREVGLGVVAVAVGVDVDDDPAARLVLGHDVQADDVAVVRRGEMELQLIPS